VASFFVSRVDTEIDSRLDKLGSPEAQALRGKAGIANAQLAYQRFEAEFATPRWIELANAGAQKQRPLWASTGVKDPAYSDTMYIDELIAPDTVNTMPEGTLVAFADHGTPQANSIVGAYATARKTLDDLAAIGIDYDDVVELLEREGVQKFEDAWTQLLDGLRTALSAAGQ
jgi:transaldolase